MRTRDPERSPPPHGGRNALLGVAVGGGSITDVTARSLRAIERSAPQCVFACANPHSLAEAHQDPLFMQALNAASIVVADGVGISLVARLLRIDVGPRITGQAYFESMMDALDKRGASRVFFFGSTDEVLKKISQRCAERYPGLTVCGTYSPPFRQITADENRTMIEIINRAQADLLWVGMTAPKQEKWVHSNAAELQVPVIGSIGAVFEFFAGTNPRAPRWICAIGLEWLYRLVREPRRMWRRTFVSAPRFLAMAVRHHVIQGF